VFNTLTIPFHGNARRNAKSKNSAQSEHKNKLFHKVFFTDVDNVSFS
jgi:hypothetical protein